MPEMLWIGEVSPQTSPPLEITVRVVVSSAAIFHPHRPVVRLATVDPPDLNWQKESGTMKSVNL